MAADERWTAACLTCYGPLYYAGVFKIPTGRQIAAARTLLGLSQRDLAKLSKVDVTTVNRLEAFAADEVRAKSETIKALVTALERQGCEITETGVQLLKRRR